MFEFRKVFKVSAMALALTGSISMAHAAPDHVYAVGTLNATPYTHTESYFKNPADPAISFWDVYRFSVSALNQATSGLVQLQLQLSPVGPALLNISNLNMQLWTDTGANDTLLDAATANPVSAQIQHTLQAGNYRLAVRGSADGMNGGVYALALAAVPEPGTLALFLPGLFAVRLLARHRSGAQAV